jgi:radical SAM superfamily enzyme YgiQ (UPF0313 family)
MKIELYHIFRHFHFTIFVYPIGLDALRLWAEACGWKAYVSVCRESKVKISLEADVVGISVYTQTAPAAYRLADKYRSKGKVVILGGPHFRGSATYNEAAPHCDVIVNSICEEQWKALLKDIVAGRISPGSQKPRCIIDTKGRFRYPDNFHESTKSLKWYQFPSIPTSIGCPYACSFCSPYLPGRYLLRDIKTIYNEAYHFAGRIIFLCDATFGLSKKFTIELMNVLAELKMNICVETTLERLKDREIVDAMALGGVKWVIVGVESPSLKLKKHGSQQIKEISRRIIDYVHQRGIFIQGNFICGLDSDGPESFDQIHQLYRKLSLDGIMLDILTPYPNTKLYENLERQGRIIDRNWEHYDYRHVVYRPHRMTADQLIDGYLQLYRMTFKTRFILNDVLRICRENGLNRASAIVIANKLYFKVDALKKEKVFRKNQTQMQLIRQTMP